MENQFLPQQMSKEKRYGAALSIASALKNQCNRQIEAQLFLIGAPQTMGGIDSWDPRCRSEEIGLLQKDLSR